MKKMIGILALAGFTILTAGLVVSHQASASGDRCPKSACPRAAGDQFGCSTCTRPCKPCPAPCSDCVFCIPGSGRAL
jgi:hypothetical protein